MPCAHAEVGVIGLPPCRTIPLLAALRTWFARYSLGMLRSVILAASRNHGIEKLVSAAPISRAVVRRFVGGSDTPAAVGVASALVEDGLTVTLDHLGEDTTDAERAAAVAEAYLSLLQAMDRAGLTERLGPLTARAEVSVKLSAVGQALPGDGEKIALEHAGRICATARSVGATVTLDMEDHTTTDSTLSILADLRADFPETGAVLQAYLRRTEADCQALAGPGSRVRLCKGAYQEPASVAFQVDDQVDRSYVRCTNILLAGDGYPMFATHDPRLVAIAQERAKFYGKAPGDYELQMLYGVRPAEQRRLAGIGESVRVYVPYGSDWYSYLMRRLAERPSNLTFFLRSLVSKR
jgi:proline dehydrogenase